MHSEFIILGGGVTGLAAGVQLKKSAVILEKEMTPGGLVQSKCFDGGYWFDKVLHLLHFKDKEIEACIKSMIGPILEPCPPVAWIESKEGTTLYPFQLNLGGLTENARNRCIEDYAKVYFHQNGVNKKKNYEEYLKETFGDAMSELFYLPYNTKLYKYPLDKIDVDEILWNLHKPSFREILEGSFHPNILRTTYNTNAFYPRPPKGAGLRGMGILSEELASKTS
jgi:protoporphyrinogen oxidase